MAHGDGIPATDGILSAFRDDCASSTGHRLRELVVEVFSQRTLA